MPSYRYAVYADETLEDSRLFESTWNEKHPYFVAADAAKHYHGRYGWEASWPIDFRIWTEAGQELGKFEVHRDFVPEFYAVEVAEATAKGVTK